MLAGKNTTGIDAISDAGSTDDMPLERPSGEEKLGDEKLGDEKLGDEKLGDEKVNGEITFRLTEDRRKRLEEIGFCW